jgi:phospho-N-acetylmuramoyl-pentapeptide-transferase
LTDGLDGLAAGTSVPFFLVMGILILLQNGLGGAADSIVTLCFCLSASLVAYLVFNVHPALVFMGDTGSLALGGFASSIALLTGNALYVAVLGFCFVLSVISVIIQVIYYKATGGKRVFLMAPIHHHFQEKGFSESRISYAYATVTFLLGGLCIFAVL